MLTRTESWEIAGDLSDKLTLRQKNNIGREFGGDTFDGNDTKIMYSISVDYLNNVDKRLNYLAKLLKEKKLINTNVKCMRGMKSILLKLIKNLNKIEGEKYGNSRADKK